MKHFVHLVASGLLLLAAFALGGCRTDDQAHSGDMASVMIDGHTAAEIRQTTVAVFLANGFEQAQTLTFEKQASPMQTAAYSGWSIDPIWIRVRANIATLAPGHCILGCDVFKVRDRNKGLLEEEQRFYFQKRDECKKLLDLVKARLDSEPASEPK